MDIHGSQEILFVTKLACLSTLRNSTRPTSIISPASICSSKFTRVHFLLFLNFGRFRLHLSMLLYFVLEGGEGGNPVYQLKTSFGAINSPTWWDNLSITTNDEIIWWESTEHVDFRAVLVDHPILYSTHPQRTKVAAARSSWLCCRVVTSQPTCFRLNLVSSSGSIWCLFDCIHQRVCVLGRDCKKEGQGS